MPRRRKYKKSTKDKVQDMRLARLERQNQANKKQIDTPYVFRAITQPGGNTSIPGGTEVGVAAVSLLECIGPGGDLVSGATTTPVGTNKQFRSDTEILLDNVELNIRLQAQSNQNLGNICVAVIRTHEYNQYDQGLNPSNIPYGGGNGNVTGPCDRLLEEITLSNPVVADGTVVLPSSQGYSTIIGNANPQLSLTPFQFLHPVWATDPKYKYEVLYFKRHRMIQATDINSPQGTVAYKYFKIRLKNKLKGLKVEYLQQDLQTTAAGLGNNAWEVARNNVYLCMWSDSSIAASTTGHPTAEVISRVKFYD